MAKSTLNKKLPKVSKIAYYSDVSKGTSYTKGYTAETGKFSVSVGMRQPSSRAYCYQMQYRWCYRYTLAQQKAKGATWTKWCAWKTPTAFGSYAKDSTADPDLWLQSNKGTVSKDYIELFKYTNVAIGASYDAFDLQVRVRTYDGKNRKHGEWVTSGHLYLYKRAEVLDECLVQAGSDCIDIDFNYKWDRGRTLYVKSLVQGGRELMKKTVSKAPNSDSARGEMTDCPKRTGYNPGTLRLKVGTDLKAMPALGTSITVDAWLQTVDGAQTKFDSPKYLISSDADLGAPNVSTSYNQSTGALTVRATKTDADDDIKKADATISYTWNGKYYTINPDAVTTYLNVASTSRYVIIAQFQNCPLNIPLTATVSFSNRYKKTKKTTVQRTIDTNMFSGLFGIKDQAGIAAWALGDMSPAFSTKRDMQVELPQGNELPMVVFGKGHTTGISLSFDISEQTHALNSASGFSSWEKVMNNPGMYVLRCYDGRTHTMAIDSVSIGAVQKGKRKVSISGELVQS